MAENITTNIHSENGEGQISFADDVVATIAGLAAIEIEGVVGMSGGVAGGIAEMLGRKNLTRGVKVEVGTSEAAIDLDIIAKYGVKIPEVARKVQENVKKAVEMMTALDVVEVNVNIIGISMDEKSKEAESTARVK